MGLSRPNNPALHRGQSASSVDRCERFPTNSLTAQLAQVVEATPVTCCDFVDQNILVAGLEDTTVSIWRLIAALKPGEVSLRRSQVMRGHSKPATCISTSRAWSMVVTGSNDCTAIIWDLNRGRYVRSIVLGNPVTVCSIQESSVRMGARQRQLMD